MGIKLGILQPGDMADVPDRPANRVRVGYPIPGSEPTYDRLAVPPYNRPPNTVAAPPPPPPTSAPSRPTRPARQPWYPRKWKPNEANREAFNEWFLHHDWQGVSDADATRLVQQKQCELDLLPPEQCAELGFAPTSQPGS
jgi:hypothetical protein